MSMIHLGTNRISPILADIAAAFTDVPDIKIQYLMTFPSIFGMIFVLVSAFMARKLAKKAIAISCLAILGLGGILAFLFHSSVTVLLIWRPS